MATAAKSVPITHQHVCSCGSQFLCDDPDCRPAKPGITPRICEACASRPPKTLLDLRREFLEGSSEIYNQFFASIAEQEALTAEQNETVAAYLATTVEKRDRLADFVKGLEEEAARLQERERQIAARRKEFEKLAHMFRASILTQMQNWHGKEIKRVDGLESSFSVRQNPPKVDVYDLAALPGEYIDYTPTPDKAAIKTALEQGKQIPGARFADPSFSLQIR